MMLNNKRPGDGKWICEANSCLHWSLDDYAQNERNPAGATGLIRTCAAIDIDVCNRPKNLAVIESVRPVSRFCLSFCWHSLLYLQCTLRWCLVTTQLDDSLQAGKKTLKGTNMPPRLAAALDEHSCISYGWKSPPLSTPCFCTTGSRGSGSPSSSFSLSFTMSQLIYYGMCLEISALVRTDPISWRGCGRILPKVTRTKVRRCGMKWIGARNIGKGAFGGAVWR